MNHNIYIYTFHVPNSISTKPPSNLKKNTDPDSEFSKELLMFAVHVASTINVPKPTIEHHKRPRPEGLYHHD